MSCSWLGIREGFGVAAALMCGACAITFPDYTAESLTGGGGQGAEATGGGGNVGGGGEDPGLTTTDKIDLLIAVDNSVGMADKQAILAQSISTLVDRFVNPLCLDANGAAQNPPADGPTAQCNTGYEREFLPVADMHIGLISSSLGAASTAACDNAAVENRDDAGHLLSRSRSSEDPVPTYQGKGFLFWDSSGERGGLQVEADLNESLEEMVIGVHQLGCGFEMQLEAVARFLVDPAPYAQITNDGSQIEQSGTDEVLLNQRRDFLRPDSLLLVVMLTDEDDCSLDVSSGSRSFQVFESGSQSRGSSTCDSAPEDACCYSCEDPPPEGCSDDSACEDPILPTEDDAINLRCWNQKQRFGVDGLYPVARYVNAFSLPEVDRERADWAPMDGGTGVSNPLFVDIADRGRPVRSQSLVYFATLAGVPWQAVANDPSDIGDGLMSNAELVESDFYGRYVGDPDGYVEPENAIMQQSIDDRGVAANQPNGGDRTITDRSSLQYACIFPLAEAVSPGIECDDKPTDNPACDGTTQIAAVAYPSLRPLAVTKGLAERGIPASICPSVIDPSSAEFGYRPALHAIVDRVKSVFKTP